MKNIVGVIIVALVVVIGIFSYFLLTGNKSAPETDSGSATISEPLPDQMATEDQTPDIKEESGTAKQEESKPLPDLDSLEGLEEESGGLFEGIDGFPGGSTENPLKDVIQ